MPYLIHGMFFQKGAWFKENSGPLIVCEGLLRFMFSGVIHVNPHDYVGVLLTGNVNDHYGDAVLSGIELTDNSLRFIKMYEKRDDPINFNFKRRGGWWVGEWEGSIVGRGLAHCVLTEVTEDFFNPEEIVHKTS